MTIKTYLTSRDLRCRAKVSGIDEEASTVSLDQTLFHPQGGGQQADTGTIADIPVLSVRHAPDGNVLHYMETTQGLTIGDEVELVVDEEQRVESARYHSAGHLIADALEELHPEYKAVQGHHWTGQARVEFEGDGPHATSILPALQAHLDAIIADNLPLVTTNTDGSNRTVRIGSYPPVGCGGTHVQSTGELAGLTLTGSKMKKGRLRTSYEL